MNRKPARARLALAAAAATLALLVAVLNFDEVEVNWFFGHLGDPLVIVIAVSLCAKPGSRPYLTGYLTSTNFEIQR